MKKISILTLCVALLAMGAGRSYAQTFTLVTSGDAGGGYTPLTTSDTSDFGYTVATAGTVQGVSFTTSLPSGDSLVYSSAYHGINPSSSGSLGTDANDVALNAVTSSSDNIYKQDPNNTSDPRTITLTLSGLTAGTVYQLDSLVSEPTGYGNQTETLTFSGGGATGSNSGLVAASYLYDFSDSFTATGGSVTVVYSTDAGDTLFSAVSLTSAAATPEPTTWAMLLGGCVALVLTRRFRKIS